MAGIKRLRKVQLGYEATPGTAVAATALWRGAGVIADDRETVFVDEDIGKVNRMGRTYVPRLGGTVVFDSIAATFEQLPYILAAAIKGVTTGAADGAGTGKVYTFPFPTTCDLTVRTYTIEGGDNQNAEEMRHSFVESFTLSGNASEALMMSANWRGAQVNTSSFTTSIPIRDVEEILAGKGALYVDADTTSFGGTLVSKSIVSVTIEANSGLKPVYTQDGSLALTQTVRDGEAMDVTARITWLHDSTAATEVERYRSEAGRKVRLQWTGSALTTAGTYTHKTLRVDLLGRWAGFDALSDQDGNDLRVATLRCAGDTAGTDYAKFVVVNNLTALP